MSVKLLVNHVNRRLSKLRCWSDSELDVKMAYYTNSDTIRELMKSLADADVKPMDNSFEWTACGSWEKYNDSQIALGETSWMGRNDFGVDQEERDGASMCWLYWCVVSGGVLHVWRGWGFFSSSYVRSLQWWMRIGVVWFPRLSSFWGEWSTPSLNWWNPCGSDNP